MLNRRIYGYIFLLQVLVVATGCGEKLAIVERVPSPDGQIVAKLYSVDAGATNPRSYELKFSVKGVESAESVIVCDRISIQGREAPPVIRWSDRNTLVVEFDQGRVFQFSNFWQHRELENFGRTIEIKLSVLKDRGIPYE